MRAAHRIGRPLAGAVVLATALAACGNGGSPSAAAEAPTELVLAIGGESEDGYDPTLGWGRYGSPLFQSTLLQRDADLDVVPDLATDWSVSEDGLVWTVDLRTDARFTDGEPVTADDVGVVGAMQVLLKDVPRAFCRAPANFDI